MPPISVLFQMRLQQNVTSPLTSAGNAFKSFFNRVNQGFLANSKAGLVFLRTLARLRTAVFLMMTVLAVRPILRFFDAINEASAEASLKLEETNVRFKMFLRDLGNTQIFKQLQAFRVTLKETVAVWAVQAFIWFGRVGLAINKFAAEAAIGFRKVIQFLGRLVFSARFLPGLIGKIFDTVALRVTSFLSDITASVMRTMGQLLTKLAMVFRDIAKKFDVEFLEPIADALSDVSFEFMAFAQSAKEISDAAATASAGAWENFKERLLRVWNFLKAAFDDMPQDLEIRAGFKKYEDDLDQLQRTLDEAKKRFQDGTATIKDFGNALKFGLAQEIRNIDEMFITLGQTVARSLKESLSDTFVALMEGSFQKVEDAFVGLLNAMKRAIADFMADAIVGDFLRSFLQEGVRPVITGLVRGLLGGGAGSTPPSGGNFQVPAGTPVMQHGGVALTPRRALIGDVPEAVIPLKHGKVPVRFQGMGIPRMGSGGAGIQQTIVFNVNTIDGATTAAFFKNNADKIKKILVEARAGGDMYVRSAFGAR